MTANLFEWNWNSVAAEFELVSGFGTPQVYSSFDWTNSDDSPPADANGYIGNTACGSGWECVDRQTGVLGMVGFHNATKGDPNRTWTTGAAGSATTTGSWR